MVVRLLVKLADLVNGIDLSHYNEGDVMELPARDAEMLLAEGWAERVDAVTEVRFRTGQAQLRGMAADRGRRRNHE